MSGNQAKSVGREFLKRLRSKCRNIEAFKADLKEFASDSAENRLKVAMGLLAIGADSTERIFDRNFALLQLAMVIGACGLRDSEAIQKELNQIIDDWICLPLDRRNRKPQELDPRLSGDSNPPMGALLALIAVNRPLGLQRLDQVIKNYGNSNSGRYLRDYRNKLP
jgi:hypothetical protein